MSDYIQKIFNEIDKYKIERENFIENEIKDYLILNNLTELDLQKHGSHKIYIHANREDFFYKDDLILSIQFYPTINIK